MANSSQRAKLKSFKNKLLSYSYTQTLGTKIYFVLTKSCSPLPLSFSNKFNSLCNIDNTQQKPERETESVSEFRNGFHFFSNSLSSPFG